MAQICGDIIACLVLVAHLLVPSLAASEKPSVHEKRIAAGVEAYCNKDKEQCQRPLSSGRVSYAWATPLMRFDVGEVEDVEKLNAPIKKVVKNEWKVFRKKCESKPGACGPPGNAEAEYNAFFDHQFPNANDEHSKLGTGVRSLQHLPEYQRLVQYIQQALDEYFLASGHNNDDLRRRPRDLQLWANVQKQSVHHHSHIHEENIVSGTYYVDVPENSGVLVLEDPRGRLSPFSRDIYHRPEAGEIILWPAWLRHSVMPNLNSSQFHARVALSFNYGGKQCLGAGQECWLRTTDIAAVFPTKKLRPGATMGHGSRHFSE